MKTCQFLTLLPRPNLGVGKSPVSVVEPSELGGEADMVIPLVVAYSGSHYEGLVPATEEDVVRCMELVEQYNDATYNTTDNDVPAIKEQLPVSKVVDNDAEYEEIKKVKPKQRTEEQRKRFNAIKVARSKRKRSIEQVIKDKESAKKRVKGRSVEKVLDEREKKKAQKKTARANRSGENAQDDRKKNKAQMKTARANRSREKVQDDRKKKNEQRRTVRKSKSSFEGRCAASLQDVPTIKELKDTKDTSGGMEHRSLFAF